MIRISPLITLNHKVALLAYLKTLIMQCHLKNSSGDANKILHRSNVRPGDDPSSANLKSDLLIEPNIVKSLHYSK